MRGRRPQGPEYAEKTTGSKLAKERAQVVLETLAGQCSVQDACERLGVRETRFHQLRADFMQGGVERLEPGAPGRPSLQSLSDAARADKLEEALEELEQKLGESTVREEIAVILGQGAAGKKTRRRKVKLRRLQQAGSI